MTTQNKKYRVVIRAFTARRDVAKAALLAKVLERQGCEVIIACVRNMNWILKTWKPHAVIINAAGKAQVVKKLVPNALLVFIDAEGARPIERSITKWWVEHPDQFEALDLALIWSDATMDAFRILAPDMDVGKVHVVGDPRIDLIHYLPNDLKTSEHSTSIGFVTKFSSINHHGGIPPIRSLLREHELDQVIHSCRMFQTFVRAIEAILEQTDLTISIRPYPNEALESYEELVKPFFGIENRDRIEIDTSLDFASWAARQKALLAETSTTFIEAYLLGVPVVNLECIAESDEFYRSFGSNSTDIQQAAIMPKDLNELCTLLKGSLEKPRRNDDIEKLMTDYYASSNERPVCLQVAEHVMELLKENAFSAALHWPRILVELRDEISFRRARRNNRLHGNFNYKKGFHTFPMHLDRMVNDILKQE